MSIADSSTRSGASSAVATSIEERWIQCGGYRTRYLVAGNPAAEPLLLLHDGALGGNASGSWSALIPLLASKYWILAPDMLGYGDTDKVVFLDRSPHSFRVSHLTEFLRTIGVASPIHVIGNSFGGAVALRSIVAPERGFDLRSVVSIAGSGGPWRTSTAMEELGRWDGTRDDLARIQRLLVDDFEGFDEHLDQRLHWASRPGHVKALNAPTGVVPSALKGVVDDPWPLQLRDETVPTLLVRCSRDVLLEPEWVDNVKGELRSASISEIDHLHAPNVDRPEELASLLLGFVGSN